MAAGAALRLLHPFPSALNAALVLAISLVAGANLGRAVALSVAMLGLQFCIGATNDIFDERLDALSKPFKPIPAGIISRRAARLVAVVTGGGGLLLAASVGPVVLVMAAAMLGAGLVYDALLKPTAFGWVSFAIAFPILPLYAWFGTTGSLPPRWELLVPVAALAGPGLQLANGLIDLDDDGAAGVKTLAVRLGRGRALAAMIATLVVVHALAWISLAPGASVPVLGFIALASGLSALGLILSAQRCAGRRGLGWSAQAGSIALLGLGWLAAAAGF